MKKMRLTEVTCFAQSYTDSRWWKRESDPGLFNSVWFSLDQGEKKSESLLAKNIPYWSERGIYKITVQSELLHFVPCDLLLPLLTFWHLANKGSSLLPYLRSRMVQRTRPRIYIWTDLGLLGNIHWLRMPSTVYICLHFCGLTACGILVPQPEMELTSLVLETLSLNHDYCCSVTKFVQLFATPWTEVHQASLSFTISQSLLNSCPLSWWCHPTISSSVASLPLLPSVFPSIRVFSKESPLCIRWPK